ncbi:MAG: HAD-IA family hydrolase [Alphaproteobacteria bacterium]|nr:HAD-IA family hydrolase [Alphaproteobacteria bacterium]
MGPSLVPCKIIIFDVDGVLLTVTDARGRYLWSLDAKEKLGFRTQHFQKIFNVDWEDCVTTGKIDTKDYLARVFHDPVFDDIQISPNDFIDYWLRDSNNGSTTYKINQPLVRFIETLEIPVGIGTNQDPYRTQWIKSLIGHQPFDFIFSSSSIGANKPDALFFHHIQKVLNVPASEILLVDDTQANIDGAKQQGWEAFFYDNSLDELIKFIDKWIVMSVLLFTENLR